jgi:hypothetical protein
MFKKDAAPLADYLLKGFSESIEMDVWDGFQQTLLPIIKTMLEEDEDTAGQ